MSSNWLIVASASLLVGCELFGRVAAGAGGRIADGGLAASFADNCEARCGETASSRGEATDNDAASAGTSNGDAGDRSAHATDEAHDTSAWICCLEAGLPTSTQGARASSDFEPGGTSAENWTQHTANSAGLTTETSLAGGAPSGGPTSFSDATGAGPTGDVVADTSTGLVAETSAETSKSDSFTTDDNVQAQCRGETGELNFAGARDVSEGGFKGPSAIVTADFNRDGLPDIAAMGESSSKIEWFAAPSDSSGPWVRHVLPSAPVLRPFLGSARAGDVNGDGNVDLVASIDNHSNAEKSAYLYWWENTGASGGDEWAVHAIYGPIDVHHINDMELADLDADGRLDVVVRSLDGNAMHLFFQDPMGWTSRTLDARPFGKQGEGFAVGQLDGERGVDIAVCGWWLESPEDPRTGEFVTHVIDSGYCTINANVKQAVGDIDGDGKMDVLVAPAEGARGGGNHVLAWYRGPDDPRTADGWQQTVIEGGLNGMHTAKLGDVDNDGDLDVLTGIAWDKWEQTRRITLYFNDGAGGFGKSRTVSTNEGLYTGWLVDLGADGDLDIVGQGTYAGSSRPDVYESLLCDTAADQ